MSTDQLVARAEELYHDLDLKVVTAWRERRGGARAIGYLPIYVPREIIDLHCRHRMRMTVVNACTHENYGKGIFRTVGHMQTANVDARPRHPDQQSMHLFEETS